MRRVDISPDKFVRKLLALARDTRLCLLDSCNSHHPGSTKLFAGIEPVEVFNLVGDTETTLATFDRLLSGERPVIFTLSYELGRKLQLGDRADSGRVAEPDMFAAVFDTLLIHDHSTGETAVQGDARRFANILEEAAASRPVDVTCRDIPINSNFRRSEYVAHVEEIKELIRCGDTYQTNLTQQITVDLPDGFSNEAAFARLRLRNPAPFAAYIERNDSTVISASPERFFRVIGREIEASPIKGTRRRGTNSDEDERLRKELLNSSKDRAENVMIIDLLRNDLGRVCEYGSVVVSELCALQELPTLFHLVSTIKGKLRDETEPSDIIRALFPCGSITGAPKHRTMQIIDRLETEPRGLSMGAIGVYIPAGILGREAQFDLSVAIRTMVIREGKGVFNVGGGITIDSDAAAEYDESWLKAHALLDALGASISS